MRKRKRELRLITCGDPEPSTAVKRKPHKSNRMSHFPGFSPAHAFSGEGRKNPLKVFPRLNRLDFAHSLPLYRSTSTRKFGRLAAVSFQSGLYSHCCRRIPEMILSCAEFNSVRSLCTPFYSSGDFLPACPVPSLLSLIFRSSICSGIHSAFVHQNLCQLISRTLVLRLCEVAVSV